MKVGESLSKRWESYVKTGNTPRLVPSYWVESAEDAAKWVCRIEVPMTLEELLHFTDSYIEDKHQIHNPHDERSLPFLLQSSRRTGLSGPSGRRDLKLRVGLQSDRHSQPLRRRLRSRQHCMVTRLLPFAVDCRGAIWCARDVICDQGCATSLRLANCWNLVRIDRRRAAARRSAGTALAAMVSPPLLRLHRAALRCLCCCTACLAAVAESGAPRISIR